MDSTRGETTTSSIAASRFADSSFEFLTTSRLADLFCVSTSRTYNVEVLSKQSVTVELMQLKRSMYEDSEGFIFKHFDTICNLLRNFGDYDEGLQISTLKVLLQVAEKRVASLSSFLETVDGISSKESLSKNRNEIKMAVYLLCHFANAFDKDLSKKAMAANIGKGRKKKSASDTDYSEWPDLRVNFVVIIKKLFKLPLEKLWDPPVIDQEFVNFVTVTFFRLLETPDVAKDKGMKTEIFRFLGTVLKEHRTGLVYSVKIIQLVQDFDHLPSVLAEGVVYFVKECSADTLVSDLLRETTLLDIDVLTQNLTVAHSVASFLTAIAEDCAEKLLPLVSCIVQFLEWESHVLRNCALTMIGTLLSKPLCSETLSERDKKLREELLEHVQAHLLDVNSFVRSRAIQVLKMLMEEKALVSVELYDVGKCVTKRLKDKASNVRKNAMGFMAEFVHANQFACQVPLPVLKGSFQNELEKLKELKKNVPVEFEDFDDEEPACASNAVIFDDSDLEEGNEKDTDGNPPVNEEDEADKENIPENVLVNQRKGSPTNKDLEAEKASSDNQDALVKQQMLVDYLKNTLNFAEVIHSIIEPIHSLLYSSTQTDVLEAIEFIIAIADNCVKGSEVGIKDVLKLVWAKEAAVREAALNAFKSMFLYDGERPREANEIAKSLIELLKSATTDDASNVQEFVKHFSQLKEIPKTLPNILWSRLTSQQAESADEEKIAIIQLLGMMTEIYPEIILTKVDNLIEAGLGRDENRSFLTAKYTFAALQKINEKSRGKVSLDASFNETRFNSDHFLISRIKAYLINGITNYDDDQWIPMSDEAVATIFTLSEEPVKLCTEITTKLANILTEEMGIANDEPSPSLDAVSLHKLPHSLLARFLAFSGHVALHYITYMKVDYFAYLRRQEAAREKRRRRSSIRAHVSSLNSSSFLSPTRSAKKRKSIHKKYKLVPPVDEEKTHEDVIEMCAKDAQNDQKLIGSLLPFVVYACRFTLKVFKAEIQAAASLSLAKFMLVSEKVCEDNMQLFATITERSPDPQIRANMIVAMGDLTTAYPNIVEPWTQQVFQRLKDSDQLVRENSIIILTHLILHDFIRIKGLISDAAKCIADSSVSISGVAKYLFKELSKKGNIIYNIIPDIISSLSGPNSGVDEETFQTVLRHMLQFIEKEKLVEGLVEKLCCRFTDSSTEVQIHELTFCLSILTLNDKCYSKLMEFKSFLKEKMSDPVVLRYITNITSNAKKNDAKTAAELEAFRTELGI